MKKLLVVVIAMLLVSGCSNTGTENSASSGNPAGNVNSTDWPVLKHYDADHLVNIAMPIGGIGTGTVSLGGRGDLRDWEIMNRAAKGFIPKSGMIGPFFVLYTKSADGDAVVRALEGPLDDLLYEGSHGSEIVNHGLPRFQNASFAAAYPFGQVMLDDPDVPLDVRLKAYNPLVPGDVETSGMPVAILTYELTNPTDKTVSASICGSIPNFVGIDGSETDLDWKGDTIYVGAKKNRNTFRTGNGIKGIYMDSEGVDPESQAWGSIALCAIDGSDVSYRTSWLPNQWGHSPLDFWDDFSADGVLENRDSTAEDMPMMSLAAMAEIAPGETKEITFLLTWHFKNRFTWTPKGNDDDVIGNYYTTRYTDAWDVANSVSPVLDRLEDRTLEFVRTFAASNLPEVVKESALFNISTLRTQTCFQTADGRFYGWEGSCNTRGCCHGSCTHVWNYEQATAFLFGDLAKSMREVEFAHATDNMGLMSFRVHLPLSRANDWGKAAADGQLGCIMKMYRDWKLSGDDEMLRSLWPGVKRSLEFCWIEGGWDADKDGVMEGCQHNTMDVEYYGPNPQMGVWYLGALKSVAEMAGYLGEDTFSAECTKLFENGSAWLDANLFNGEYYEHQIVPPASKDAVAPSLLIGMGSEDVENPDYQLGAGCLVDQLVGQFMAHVCGLGYLTDEANVKATLESIMKYNLREGMNGHFNCMRSFALGDESALLMASYPKERPANPFPYFTEVMTGFEYAAAVHMLYEDQNENGLRCIKNIRDRYDGRRRSPFDEAECGHHYARAMASWGAVLALSGFEWSGVEGSMTFAQLDGDCFWSNGSAWGNCTMKDAANGVDVSLKVMGGELDIKRFVLRDVGEHIVKSGGKVVKAGDILKMKIAG